MDYKKIMDSLFKENFELEQQRDKFEQMINEECERGYKMEGKYNDMKAEQNSLIDDLSWYKAKVSRLEREKEEFQRKLMAQLEVNTELRMSNKDKHAILSEISQHIGNKPSSSTYKYFRGKLDDLNITEDK